MNPSLARQQLQEYADQERRIQRRFIAPTMIFFAIFAFLYLVTGSYGGWWTHLVMFGFFAIWFAYSMRLTGVNWTRPQNRKLGWTLGSVFCWIIVCNAYFVNWNPQQIPIPYAGILGGLLAALPPLVLARTYRP